MGTFTRPSDNIYDIGIVGGGPAGLSAALWSARYRHSVVLVDSGDPRNWETRGVNGYLGLPGVKPADLRGKGRDDAAAQGAHLIDSTVLLIERKADETFEMCLDGGDAVYCRRLLLAFGLRDVWPDIPGLERVYGANAHVCPDCDGPDTMGRKVVVIGCGKRVVATALALTTWTNDIVICTNGRPPEIDDDLLEKLQACGIPVLTNEVVKLEPRRKSISSIVLDDGSEIDADKLFFNLAQYPADDLGGKLGCERDRGGHIVISDHHATSVRDVFAAGDVTPGPQLAIRAAAGGAVAAMAMHRSLVPEHRKL